MEALTQHLSDEASFQEERARKTNAMLVTFLITGYPASSGGGLSTYAVNRDSTRQASQDSEYQQLQHPLATGMYLP